jgi:cation diffusion facilitator family transporter
VIEPKNLQNLPWSFRQHGTDSSEQGKEAIRITSIGMVLNVTLAIGKAGAGVYSGSAAMIADAGHSFSDLLSDVVTIWAVKLARTPADTNHPYGHGKFEAVGSAVIGGLLIGTGAGLGIHAIEILQHGMSDNETMAIFNDLGFGMAAAVAVGSIASKEWLYHATVKVGRETRSKVLEANAWHHRTDALSSVAALGGVMGAYAGFPLLDPLAGLVVAGMVVRTGVEVGLESIQELTDESVEEVSRMQFKLGVHVGGNTLVH